MNKRHARLFSLIVFLLAAASFLCLARFTSTAQQTSKSKLFAGDPALKDLAQYRHWTRVNEKPLDVSAVSLVTGDVRLVEGVNFPAV